MAGDSCVNRMDRYAGRMAIELRHLRILVAVADEGSFTAAGAAVGGSQTAVSRAIAQLEGELGCALVLRTTRRVTLTPAGRTFAAEARRALVALDAAVAAVRGEPAAIRLGFAWAALGAMTTPIVRRWNAANPDPPLRLLRRNDPDAGLDAGQVDLAVVRGAARVDGELRAVLVGHESRVCAMAIDHPLADRARIQLADLAGTQVATDRRTGTTTATLWTDAGLAPPPFTATGDVEEWMELIAAGEAVGVTAVATAEQYSRPGVVFAPIDDAPGIPVHVMWHRGRRHPATDRLVAAIVSAYREAPAGVGGRAYAG